MPQLFAGIDSSTQSTKLVIIDEELQALVYTDSVQYDIDLPEYQTRNGVRQDQGQGVSESAPRMWIAAIDMLLTRLQNSPLPQEQIRCLSVSGQQHGLVTLDEKGELTRATSKLWNDFSTEEECRLLTDAVGGPEAMISEVGNSQRTGYTAAKIYHMARNEPEAFARTSTCFLVHNFINWYLTGGPDGGVRVMEPGDVSGMALWHPATRKWSSKVIQAISPELMAKLPPVRPSERTIGKIGSLLAKRFGLNPECRVDAGCGDNMYGAVGTGNVEPGIVTVSLGTSGTAYTFLPQPFIDPCGEIAAFCDSTGHYLPLLCVSNLANGYNNILEQFQIDHDRFNERIGRTSAGNHGRLLIPWYVGERTPDVPLAAPFYFGFELQDFSPEVLCRAVLEGHILNLYDGFRKMPLHPSEIRLTGGLSQSDAWCQTIADIFETETVPVEGEGAALGAALHAAWVWQNENKVGTRLQQVVKPYIKLREEKRKKPDPKSIESYRILKRLFHALSERLRGVPSEDDPFALRQRLL